jgi:hypothetical protein
MDIQQQEKRLMVAAVFFSSVGLEEQIENDIIQNEDENYESLDISNVKRFLLFDVVDQHGWAADSVEELLSIVADSTAPFRNATYIWDLDKRKIILEMNISL